MSDLIERQEIIDRLDRVIEKGLVNILSGEHPITAEVMKEVIMALPSAQPEPKRENKQQATVSSDLISRQDAIDEIESDAEFLKRVLDDTDIVGSEREKFAWGLGLFESLIEDIKGIPSAQLDRDIPRKPIEGCSLSGRKKIKEASCRNCNYFLSHYHFYGEGKRITYCEHCGQAIDWEGWEWDE